jgi:thiamine transport system permease protein
LGASPWRAFRAVTLPALAPAIASAASLVFLFCATAFGTVLVLGGPAYGTVETEIWVQTTQFLDLRTAAVLSVVQLVVVGASLTVSGWSRRRRESALRVQADTTTDHRWRPWSRVRCVRPRAGGWTTTPSSRPPAVAGHWRCRSGRPR